MQPDLSGFGSRKAALLCRLGLVIVTLSGGAWGCSAGSSPAAGGGRSAAEGEGDPASPTSPALFRLLLLTHSTVCYPFLISVSPARLLAVGDWLADGTFPAVVGPRRL